MLGWVQTAQHVIGSEVDELLLHSARIYRVLASRGGRRMGLEEVRKMRGWVRYYLEQGYPERPARFFSAPRKAPRAAVVEERPFADGTVRLLAFRSGYRVRNPSFREIFSGFEANRIAYLVHWTHGDAGRNTVLCCHGWSLGDPAQAERMFRIHNLYRKGLDVALFITPFHWKRAPSLALRFSPPFPFEHPVLGLEGFGQAMFDLAGCILLLRQGGAERIGLIGASLGGYLVALFVSVSRLADLATLVVPLVGFHRLRVPTTRLPAGPGRTEEGLSLREEVSRLWRIHSPLSHRCKLPPQQCLLIASKGDRLCPFEDVRELYAHWGRPEHLFLRGGHALFFPRKARGESWYAFLARNGFG